LEREPVSVLRRISALGVFEFECGTEEWVEIMSLALSGVPLQKRALDKVQGHRHRPSEPDMALSCTKSAYGERLATFFGPAADTRDPVAGVVQNIPAARPFLVTFHYIDAQPGLNRICDMTVGFTPEAGEQRRPDRDGRFLDAGDCRDRQT
jgi:hypothetical protein